MSATGKRDTVEAWKGDFGNDYIERNAATSSRVRQRARAWANVLQHLSGAPPQSILEVGCNVGIALRALSSLVDADLFGIEPNDKARGIAIEDGVVPESQLKAGVATDIPFDDGSMDLVFTSGVLIHVAPENLDRAYNEIYRVSKKYIVCFEYFSQKPETIEYRGETGLLFKRDFGGHWLDLYPDLEPVAQGFCWKRTTGLDDSTWWLFRKP